MYLTIHHCSLPIIRSYPFFQRLLKSMPPTIDDPRLESNPKEIYRFVRACQSKGETVAVVPTMGALHDGHLSLVAAASDRCDRVVTTIFVNPTQFAPHEDLDQYPRTLSADLERLDAYKVDKVFTPSRDSIYPPGFSTYVEPPTVALPLEGKCRPTFFRGVTTIVLKLFQMIPADVAVFGQKDFQQAAVVTAMTRDLNLATEIDVRPIVREHDGLAMSSRNAYLDERERATAKSLFQALKAAQSRFADGESRGDELARIMQNTLIDGGVDKVDYAVVRDPISLEAKHEATEHSVALIAAHVGSTRLIDNTILGERLQD